MEYNPPCIDFQAMVLVSTRGGKRRYSFKEAVLAGWAGRYTRAPVITQVVLVVLSEIVVLTVVVVVLQRLEEEVVAVGGGEGGGGGGGGE